MKSATFWPVGRYGIATGGGGEDILVQDMVIPVTLAPVPGSSRKEMASIIERRREDCWEKTAVNLQ
ncbi:MAG TPA: hypothetical protein ENI89_13460 [Desulfobulbus sp.]|nr:hypothetical protein [Desulfobulbus sp.]